MKNNGFAKNKSNPSTRFAHSGYFSRLFGNLAASRKVLWAKIILFIGIAIIGIVIGVGGTYLIEQKTASDRSLTIPTPSPIPLSIPPPILSPIPIPSPVPSPIPPSTSSPIPSPIPSPTPLSIPSPTPMPAPVATVDQLPIPKPAPTPSQPIDETGLGLSLPTGYKISYFTKTNLGPLRLMAFSPDGILFVTKPSNSGLYSLDTEGGEVLTFPDKNKDGLADEAKKVIGDLIYRPHGIVFFNGYLYIAEENRVSKYKYLQNGNVGPREHVVNLPTGNDHVSRTIGFSPAGKMYVSIGSSCNICIEQRKENAAILEFNPDGSGQSVFAEGIRNAVGFVFHKTTGDIWATENGRDNLGDDIPPDEINIIKKGSHYGWPFCYGKNYVDPEYNNSSFCALAKPSTWNIQAHSAPLGLRFIESAQFSQWKDDLLVAFHGSWNRNVPTGYKVVRLDVSRNSITKEEDFITGWLKGDQVSGRPVDIIFDSDGALYISDDKLGVIYRVIKQ